MPKCPIHHLAFPEGQQCKLCLANNHKFYVKQTNPNSTTRRNNILFVLIAGVIVSTLMLIGQFWINVRPTVGLKIGNDIDHFKSLCKKDAGEFITERIDNVTSIAQLQPPAQCPKRDTHTQVADVPEWVLLCSDNWLADRPSNLGLLPTSHYSIFETQQHSGEKGVLERIANHQYQKHASNYEKHKFTYSEAEKGKLSSRFGYTWKFFRSDSFPKRIAGIQVDIIDNQEKKVIAYKREYVLYRENRTPANLCADLDRTGNFVQRVLRPPFHEDFERAFTPSIKENKELFEGVKSFYAHDFQEAKRLLIPLALSENPDAAIYLGRTVLTNKENHWPPYLSPIKLFKAAADAGHPVGMHLYGDKIINTNKKEGLAYIRRAAENGWVQSILQMSHFYNNGSRYYYRDSQYNNEGNIEIDRVKALAWLLLVKEHPEKIRQDSTNLDTELYVAEIEIQNISAKLSKEQIKEATKIAKEWVIGHSI